jgi:Amt family ammonium transporter
MDHMRTWLMTLGVLLVVAVLAVFLPMHKAAHPGGPINSGDTAWMLAATALVLLMTPGLSFFYGGMVRSKSVISTMLQSFIAMGVVSLLWVIVGFSLAFGTSLGGKGTGLIGDPRTFFFFNGVTGDTEPDLAPTIPLALFSLFQLKFAIITPALVSGSFAERVRFSSYLVFISLFSLLIYCPLAHWTWHPNGFLHVWGVLDFAGGSVVHMSSGLAALAGAVFLGRRKDHQRGQANEQANIPFVLLGTGMLWFGWFGFNAGSALTASGTAALAFLTTNTASAAAMLTWITVDRVRGLKVSALNACIGAVVGLVAITPAAGYVTVGASICIGVFGAIVSNTVAHWKSRSSLDDTLDVFPCHGMGGMFGLVITGVLASAAVNPAGANGLLFGGTRLFLFHLLALVIVGVYAFGGSFLLYKLTDLIVPMRVKEDQEAIGLDLSQHGESAHSWIPRLGGVGALLSGKS